MANTNHISLLFPWMIAASPAEVTKSTKTHIKVNLVKYLS